MIHRYLITAPAVWGKLPTHNDYFSHRTQAGQAQQWQAWLDAHASHLVLSAAARQQQQALTRKVVKHTDSRTWLSLEPKANLASVHDAPVSFLLPPGTLAFSGKRYVVGVIMQSADAIGRSHPLITYSLASRSWLAQYWRHKVHEARDWQYWVGRWLVHVSHMADAMLDKAHQGQTTSSVDIGQLLAKGIDALWNVHAPTWHDLFMAPQRQPLPRYSERAIEQTLLALSATQLSATQLPESTLRGVSHMPWVDWPERALKRKNPQTAFWQQDHKGRYIGVAEHLMQFDRTGDRAL